MHWYACAKIHVHIPLSVLWYLYQSSLLQWDCVYTGLTCFVCMELMQKHWVLILHLKTKYINRCQFIWWTIRQRLLAFLSLSSIAPPEIISSLPKSYFQIANSPIKEKKQKPKGNDLTLVILSFTQVHQILFCQRSLLVLSFLA